MTICIGVVCDKGQKAILAADRMITVDMLSQEYEHGIPKCDEVSDSCLVLTAGSALLPAEVFYEIKAEITKLKQPIIRDIVEEIKRRYVAVRKKNVEEMYLTPRGFTMETFYQKVGELPPQIGVTLDNKIESGGSNGDGFNLQIIVGGVDELGGHIYIVEDPGTSACFDDIGYACIGSGEPHAFGSFIATDFTHNTPLNEALYLTYEAKVRAQRAPGVGQATDLWVITEKGIKKVQDETLSELGKIYDLKLNLEKERSKTMADMIKKIKVG